MNKKEIRAAFRRAVFERDGYRCVTCKSPGRDRQGGDEHTRYHSTGVLLDAHHITSRKLMPNGGYVPENGISVCDTCHAKAEADCLPGFTPDDLYAKIGSSYQDALEASQKLE